MSERKFKGFEFKPYDPNGGKIVIGGLTSPTEVVPLGNPPAHKDLWHPDLPSREGRTPTKLLGMFIDTLGTISRNTGKTLSMAGIDVQFVPPEDFHPKTAEERANLVERYGEYIIDGTAGDCKRNPDGTFSIRISNRYLGAAEDDETALELLGHEYGHTLGPRLKSSVDEELKAYSFANLALKTHLDVDFYSAFQFSTDTVHDEARYRLDMLTSHIGPPEIALAHLTGEPFGDYLPDDYLKFLKK